MRSETIKRTLQKLFFTTEFAELRNTAMTELAQKGVALTDDDIFKDVS